MRWSGWGSPGGLEALILTSLTIAGTIYPPHLAGLF